MPRISRTFRATTPPCCAGSSRSTASGSSANSSSSDPWRRPGHAVHHALPPHALLGRLGGRPAAGRHRLQKGRCHRDAAPATTRGEPMDQHARDTLAELGLRLADALHALAEELRELPEGTHAPCGSRWSASRKRSAPPRAARPPGARPAPWRRYGRATAGSLTPASSARPPASMPRSSPPRRRAAGVAMCLGTTTPEHGGCSVCPCSWFAASQLPEEDR